MSMAVRSTGTLPSLPSSTAAALRFGPYDTAPTCPNGGAAVVIVPQPQRRRGSPGTPLAAWPAQCGPDPPRA
ncbi:hypothetical protein [Haloechinothrix salitolerans]|uniref:Uncharacterized protein n=1 Tax=Haloechinothrix salitolerans TaxID=926830 RepID=A0ABW2C7Y1_9PSEU